MKGKLANEVKTGIVVLICAVIFLFIMVKIGGISFEKKGYEVKAVFTYLGGVEQDAPVRLSGIEVGKVSDLEIDYSGKEPKIILTLLLKNGTQLREDSKAYVSTLGLMGEMYIELTFGSSDMPILKPGSILEGEKPFKMDEFMKKAEGIADNLDKAITDVRSLTQNVDGVISDNKQDISGILKNLEITSKNFMEFSTDIKEHPWKLLFKGKEKVKSKRVKKKRQRDKKVDNQCGNQGNF